MGESGSGATLIVDVGVARTKAALFDVVEGVHRYLAGGVAPTTLHGPDDDVSVGMRAAISRIEELTGRRVFGSGGPLFPQQSDGNGIDALAITSSLGEQLRLLLLADDSTSNLSSLVKAIAQAQGAELEVFPPSDDPLPQQSKRAGALLAAAGKFDPHAIVIVGPDTGNPSSFVSDIADAVSRELRYAGDIRPAIIFVGSHGDSTTASRFLKDRFDFRAVLASEQVANQDTNQYANQDTALRLEQQLTKLWQDRIIEDVPGFSLVASWLNQQVLPSALCFGRAVSFLSRHFQRSVVGIDVGASKVVISRIQGNKQEMLISHTRSDGHLEIGHATMALRKATESCRGAARFPSAERQGLLVGSGGLFVGSTKTEILTALLDGIEPSGVFDIAVDQLSILPQVGALAELDPRAAANIACNDGPTFLATCLACSGVARPKSLAMKLEFKSPNGNGKGTTQIDIPFGSVQILPSSVPHSAEVLVKVAGNVDIGWGKGKGGKAEFQPGPLGLVVDARGRPMQLDQGKE